MSRYKTIVSRRRARKHIAGIVICSLAGSACLLGFLIDPEPVAFVGLAINVYGLVYYSRGYIQGRKDTKASTAIEPKDNSKPSTAKKTISESNRPLVIIIAIVCTTIVFLSATGAWFIINQRQIDQKNRELKQQKDLVEYEQTQLNNRERLRQTCNGDNRYAKFGAGC